MVASGYEKTTSSISAQRRTEAERKTAELLNDVATTNLRLTQTQLALERERARFARSTIGQAAFAEMTELLKPLAGTLVHIAVFDDHLEDVRHIEAGSGISLYFQDGWQILERTDASWLRQTGDPLPRYPGEVILFSSLLRADEVPMRYRCENLDVILNREQPHIAGSMPVAIPQSGVLPPNSSQAPEQISRLRIQIGQKQIT